MARVEHDDPEAMRLLGQFYWAYASDPEALKKAVFWIERAATVDDHVAQKLASDFYEKGIGVPRDPQRSAWFAWFAARSGDADAQQRYAHFLESGYGLARNPVEARAWYQRAADQGQPMAARWMGDDLSRNTTAGDPNRGTAIRYYAIAARQGDAQAAAAIQALSTRLSQIAGVRPNVNIRSAPSLAAQVVARTARITVMYSLGEQTDGWVEVYRPDGYVTGYASRGALFGS